MGAAKHYFLAFEGSKELLECNDKKESAPVGALALSFVEMDWGYWQNRAAEVRSICKRQGDAAKALKSLCRDMLESFREGHVFLKHFVVQQMCNEFRNISLELRPALDYLKNFKETEWEYIDRLFDESYFDTAGVSNCFVSKAVEWIQHKLNDFDEATQKIQSFIGNVLDIDEDPQNWDICRRYAFYRATDPTYQQFWPIEYEKLTVETHVAFDDHVVSRASYYNGKAQTERLKKEIEELKNKKVQVNNIWASDSLVALVLLELDYMVKRQVAFRKCWYCGKYFLPRAVDSIYCDRPVEGDSGKTCKEVAPKDKYRESLADALKNLHNTLVHRVQQWVSVNKDNERNLIKHFKWKEMERILYGQVKSGEWSFEEYKNLLDLDTGVIFERIQLGKGDIEDYEKMKEEREKRKKKKPKSRG